MAREKTEATAGTFLELLQQQIDFLQNDDYGYTQLLIYTAGTDEPWTFPWECKLHIDEEQGILVGREGREDNKEVPEYLIRLSAIVGSQLE